MIEKYVELGKHYQDIYSKKYKLKPVVKTKEKLTFREFAKQVHNKEKGFYDLADFQLEMAEWRLSNIDNVSMILATRGIGKSDIITCLTSLYSIYLEPTKSLIIITDKATKGQRLLKYIKDIIINSLDILEDFDLNRLLQTQLSTRQNKRKEPSIFIGSLGETLRGIHPDYSVFDDILTRETAWSSTTRENVFEKYEEVKKLTSNILIIGNVCHQLDLYSQLRETEIPKFEIFHDDHRIPQWLKPDLEKERAERVSESNIQANYFGIILPDETVPFFDIQVMSVDSLPEISLKMIAYYDFSMGKNDANALSIAFLYNFKCYIIGYAKVCRWSDFIRETESIINELEISHVFYENNSTGEEPIDIFSTYGIKSTGQTTTLNKRLKINRLIGMAQDIILLSTNNKLNRQYIEDFKHYNPSDSKSKDDAPDSATMCLIQMGYIK
jgi:hypothetical protein